MLCSFICFLVVVVPWAVLVFLATVPPEFLNPDADCGVIAIWTRRGG